MSEYEPRGLVGSVYTRLESGWNAWSDNKLADAHTARAKVVDGQTAITEARTRLEEQRQRLFDIPERYRQQRALTYARYAEEHEAIHRTTELNRAVHVRQLTREAADLTLVQMELVHARTARLDAEQQYAAQEKYGQTAYELRHVINILKTLEIELSKEERRAWFGRSVSGVLIEQREAPALPAPDDSAEVDRALLNRREALLSNDDSTDAVDAVIADRARKRTR